MLDRIFLAIVFLVPFVVVVVVVVIFFILVVVVTVVVAVVVSLVGQYLCLQPDEASLCGVP